MIKIAKFRRSLKEIIIGNVAERMVVNIKEPPIIANKKSELKDSKVAFITTAGVHLKSDQPFNTKGDHTFRIVPGNVDFMDLTITHEHYNIDEAMKDKNCVFPLEVLRNLSEEGLIKEIGPHNFGLMGYIPEIDLLINKSAPRIADILEEDGIDIVLLSPG